MSSRSSLWSNRRHRSSSSNPPISNRSSKPPRARNDEARTARQNPTSRRASDVCPGGLSAMTRRIRRRHWDPPEDRERPWSSASPETLSERGPTAPTSPIANGARSSSSQPEGTTVSLFKNTRHLRRASAAPWLHPRANPWFSSLATTSNHPYVASDSRVSSVEPLSTTTTWSSAPTSDEATPGTVRCAPRRSRPGSRWWRPAVRPLTRQWG